VSKLDRRLTSDLRRFAPGSHCTALRSARCASYAGWLSYDAVSWALMTVRPSIGATSSASGRQPPVDTGGVAPLPAAALIAAASFV